MTFPTTLQHLRHSSEHSRAIRFALAGFGLTLIIVVLALAIMPVQSATSRQSASPSSWYYYSYEYVNHVESVPFVGTRDRTLRVDAQGQPRMAYGGDQLRYLWRNGDQWQADVIDPGPKAGAHAALKMDAAGHPYISYADDQLGALKYAWHDGSAWHITIVDQSGKVTATSLNMDAAWRPHIAYVVNDTVLKHAWFDGTHWQTETLRTNTVGLLHPSLIIDGQNVLHLVFTSLRLEQTPYGNDYYSKIVYARRAATWAYTDLAEYLTGDAGHASIVLDRQAHPQISFIGQTDLVPMFASYDGAAWQVQAVGDSSGYNPSLALDLAGRPHISYNTATAIKHAWRDDAGWHTEIVDASTGASSTSLAVFQPTGWLHLGYYTGDYMKHAWFDGARWHTEFVDSDLLASLGGQQHSMVLDRLDRPVLAAYTPLKVPYGSALLQYITYAGEINGHVQWSRQNVDSGQTGTYPSLALDQADRPHIAYCDYTQPTGGLKYASFDGTYWQRQWIDQWATTNQEACKSTTLVLDSFDRPHVSYVDSVNGHIKYAWRDDGGWHTEIVTTTGTPAYTLGKVVALALDDSARPHLIIDGGGGRIRHAWRDATLWHFELIASDAVAGRGVAAIIDHQNHVHTAYAASRDLKYAHFDGNDWQFESIDSVPDFAALPVFALPVLVFDSVGQPVVAYYGYRTWGDPGPAGVRVMQRDGTAWQLRTRWGYENSVSSISLALDRLDLVHLTYFEPASQYLLYVFPILTPLASLNLQIEPATGVVNGDTLTYTLTIDGLDLDLDAILRLPAEVTYVPGSVGSSGTYSPTAQAIMWHGQTSYNSPHVIQFQAVVTSPLTGAGPAPSFLNRAEVSDDLSRTVCSTVIVNPYRFFLPIYKSDTAQAYWPDAPCP